MMTLSLAVRIRIALFASLAVLAACSARESAQEQETAPAIRIDGSSTVFPLTQAVVAAMAAEADAPLVAVAESGTSAGIAKLCNGEIHIAGASRPIQTREIVSCFRNGVSYVEVPVGFDGLTIIVHPSNPLTVVTTEDLAAMWSPDAQGEVMTWRQVNSRWRDQPLVLFGPGAQSGTFDYFTEAVVGQTGQSRADYTASEDDNVIVEGVASDPNALGYLGHAYFERNRERLKALAINAGVGPVMPTAEAIASGEYAPLSRPIFIYINAQALGRPEVARFVEYYLTHAEALSAEVGYVPLPSDAYATYLARVQERRVGTAFSGRPATGLTIEEVIAAPLIEPSS